MSEEERPPDAPEPDQGLRVALVGPCGSGKSTLAHRLRALGVDARMPAQEHSGVPEMWRTLLDPDLLVSLDAPDEVLRARRPGIDLNERLLVEQRRRLAHAVSHAQLHFDTNALSADEIERAILDRLRSMDA